MRPPDQHPVGRGAKFRWDVFAAWLFALVLGAGFWIQAARAFRFLCSSRG